MKQTVKEKSFERYLGSNLVSFQLGLLRKAVNYQKWTLQAVYPFLGKRILEVGAGIGNMSRWLPFREKLIFSEVEAELFPYLKKTREAYFEKNENIKALKSDLNSDWVSSLKKENVDTIVSFNVMEHVQDDKQFFANLVSILKESNACNVKRLITFVPAHQFAYGSVDKGYGHFRRYSLSDLKRMKNKILPQAAFWGRYFNVVGLPGWILFGRIFKRKELDEKSVLFFEKVCPWVKPFDDFLHLKLKLPLGQSVLSVVSFD